MIGKLISAFAAFCVATVLTQMILLAYFVVQGNLNGDTSTQIIALLNGIDISGNRLQQVLRASEDREQPDFDEILEARKLKSYDMDMRLRSQKMFREDLSTMLAELTKERTRFDERLVSFQQELDEIRQGAQKAGLQDVQRTIQSLDAEQAKQQLLIMYEDERIDEVVTIVQAMSTDKRKDILAEFTSKDEADKLAEILRRIGQGMPTTTLIDEASQNR
ncbi:MAG: hypothetical protein AAGI63_07780 [Planctomycetota bacterium]